jgi:hypothetical protein
VNIDDNVGRYMKEARDPGGRSASFDYCFNYFQAHRDAGSASKLAEPEHLQTACLQLGFYLASWGMFRGRAALRTCSLKVLEPTIATISMLPSEVWTLDVDDYTSGGIDRVLDTGRQLAQALPGGTSATLVTKAMLGVLGCVPAYDRYLRNGMRLSLGTTPYRLSRRSLQAVADFYDRHSDAIDAQRIPTLEFASGSASQRFYTKAKIIDMVFFIEGGG